MLFKCNTVKEVLDEFYETDSLTALFESVSAFAIIEYLKEPGLFPEECVAIKQTQFHLSKSIVNFTTRNYFALSWALSFKKKHVSTTNSEFNAQILAFPGTTTELTVSLRCKAASSQRAYIIIIYNAGFRKDNSGCLFLNPRHQWQLCPLSEYAVFSPSVITNHTSESNGPLTRYVKLGFAHAPGTISPPPWVSDPNMHHDTCVTHVPWCMSGSLTNDFLWNLVAGKTFPAHAQPAIFRIW